MAVKLADYLSLELNVRQKTILTMLIIVSLLLSGASVTLAQTNVIYPAPRRFDDFDNWLENWTENAVEADFFASVEGLTMEAAASQLALTKGNVSFSPLAFYFAFAALESDALDSTTETGNLYRLTYDDNEVGRQKTANTLFLNDKQDVSFTDLSDAWTEAFYTEHVALPYGDRSSDTFLQEWLARVSDGQLESTLELEATAGLTLLNTFTFFDEWVDLSEIENAAAPFFKKDGTSTETTYVKSRAFTPLHVGSSFTRAEKLLKNGNHMVIVLPHADSDVRDVVVDGETLRATLESGDTTYAQVDWRLPTFFIQSDLDLKPIVEALGLSTRFSEATPFSILSEPTKLDQWRHMTAIELTAQGISTTSFKSIPT